MNNLRAIALMVLAMAGFALEDTFIKLSSATLPAGQIVIIIGALGAIIMGATALARGHNLFEAQSFNKLARFRIMAELAGAVCFISAITLTPLSSASAILQASPLIVTLGGAIFLGETVGWRRWSAIFVGLLGVVIIVRPGMGDFQAASLFAVGAATALAIRDLLIRASPPAVNSTVMAFQGVCVFGLSGFILLIGADGIVAPSPSVWVYLVVASILGVFAYLAIISSIRLGEVAIIMPFRYTRLIFAMVIGIVVFAERPDIFTYFGASLVIVSGLYTLYREALIRNAPPRA